MHQTKAGPGAVSPGDSKAPHRPASAPPRSASAKAGRRRVWAAEDQARAEGLRAQGLSPLAIGEALGFSRETVRYRLDPEAAEKHRESDRRWRQANPEKAREAVRDWRKANPEKDREQKHRWREANPEKDREMARRWAAANPEKVREKSRRWCKANPEKVREYVRRRRSLKRPGRKAALAPLTLQQKGERFALFGDRCAYCGSKPDGPLTVDHVLALVKGGLDEAANVIPACDRCNKSKNDSPVEEWFRRQPFFTEARWKLIRRHAPAAAGGQPSLALGLQVEQQAEQGGRP